MTDLSFEAIAETAPGPKWRSLFERHWPAYQAWFLSDGDTARPPYLSSLRALKSAMPEIVPTYERLCQLAGGGDAAARFLTLYCPPPYFTGCSQVVWPGDEPILIRNYDYAPRLCEATILCTSWNGRRVLASGDCAWGALDGMNEDGLAVSLTFGGRRAVGNGFGMPLLLRYVLEFCTTVDEAAAALKRIPTHMAYNVTIVDRRGEFLTLFLSPDRSAVVHRSPLATNHQGRVEWHRHAAFTRSLERERYLQMRIARRVESVAGLIADFLKPPLYSTDYEDGFGTLYTAVYYLARGTAEFHWPNAVWEHSFAAFTDDSRLVQFPKQPSSRTVGRAE